MWTKTDKGFLWQGKGGNVAVWFWVALWQAQIGRMQQTGFPGGDPVQVLELLADRFVMGDDAWTLVMTARDAWPAFEASLQAPAEPDKHKHDTGKPDLTAVLSLPLGPLAELAKVRAYGVAKYGGGFSGVSRARWVAGILRHLWAEVQEPGSRDSESGCLHLAHVACGALLAMGVDRD